MNVLALIQLILSLLRGVASGLGKAHLDEEAAGVQAAITALENVHGSLITKAQVDALRITPTW